MQIARTVASSAVVNSGCAGSIVNQLFQASLVALVGGVGGSCVLGLKLYRNSLMICSR